MKTLYTLFIAIALLLTSCGDEEKGRRRRMDFNEVKPELNLSQEQEEKFDAIISKYEEIRENSRGAEGVDRATRMAQFRDIIKKQNEEIRAVLNAEQKETYNKFAKKFERFGKPGYPDELISEIKQKLDLNEQQEKMLVAVNKTFEKSYVNAHDYYHGNSEAAREYWNKFDEERKKALKKVFTEEQYTKFLEIVDDYGFRGEHNEGGKKEEK